MHNFKGAKESINASSIITQELRSSIIRGVPEIKTPPLIDEQPFLPKNIINILKWHSKRRWRKRKISDIDKIIVHQSMTEGTVSGINDYHVTPSPRNHISENGAPHICYHYVISADKIGTVYQCNELEDIVWGCRGQNFRGIQVLVVGNFDGVGYHHERSRRPYETQIKALTRLVQYLKNKDNDWEIFGHHHFGKLACPGYLLSKQLEAYNG